MPRLVDRNRSTRGSSAGARVRSLGYPRFAAGARSRFGINSRRGERGLTLVELLVGLAIAGLAAAAVLLALPPGRESLPAEAERLAAKLRAAADLAVISGRMIGVEVTARGYRFYRREAQGWEPLAVDPALEAGAWSTAVTAHLVREGAVFAAADDTQGGATSPGIRFDPIGLATPFELRLAAADEALRIRGDMAGAIILEADDV